MPRPPGPLERALTRIERWLDELGLRLKRLGYRIFGDPTPMEEMFPAPPQAPSSPADAFLEGLTQLGLLGEGGMGQVWRVQDPALGRTLALKVLRDWQGNTPIEARFLGEAQITAQLQHPGIVPIIALGRLRDGRLAYAMQEVKGPTLDMVIAEVHVASLDGSWRAASSGWTFRRLIDAFHRTCEIVAYAHSRGVLHRDLKPQNIMVGAFGEVLVLDWGIARLMQQGASEPPEPSSEAIQTTAEVALAHRTVDGEAKGTPAYMSPEQARGALSELGPPSDVYSLGATLFQILTGKVPFRGPNVGALLASVIRGHRLPLIGPAPIPDDLARICDRAMAVRRKDRYPDARALAADISDWLDGARRREVALGRVEASDASRAQAAEMRARVGTLRAAAAEILTNLPATAEEELKHPGWALDDEATELERKASLAELESTQQLAAALTEVADLAEAHERLADLYRARMDEAEQRRDEDEAARMEVLLRAHDRGRHVAWLKGDGAITLVTEPAGALATLYRYEVQHRRLVPVLVRELGQTPIIEAPLERGSYLVVLTLAGHGDVRYPVSVGRLEHASGVRPGDAAPTPIWLPPEGALHAHELYVPAGWSWCGELEHALPGAIRLHRHWIDSFIVRRFPVTHGELLDRANALIAAGHEDEALQFLPRTRDLQELPYGRDEQGRLVLQPDPEGDLWQADWPAFLLTWHEARAFAQAEVQRTGQPWRLPLEAEWEKAARGGDYRRYPWGDRADHVWANLRDARPGRPMHSPVTDWPVDESPFGVRGVGGGVADWCLDPFVRGPDVSLDPLVDRDALVARAESASGVTRALRGGAFAHFRTGSMVARRVGVAEGTRDYGVGFRLVRPLP